MKKLPEPNSGRASVFFVVFALMNFSLGCISHQNDDSSDPILPERQVSVFHRGRTFVLHHDNDLYLPDPSSISLGQTGISCELFPAPDSISRSLDDISRFSWSLIPAKNFPTQQVHIFAEGIVIPSDSRVFIPFFKMTRTEVYQNDYPCTGATWQLTCSYGFASAPAFFDLVLNHSRSFSPSVYVHNGEKYVFAGEVIPGVSKPGLERTDYLVLQDLRPVNERYNVRIANEAKEIQYINLVQLRVIDHPAEIGVLIDKYGRLKTISEAVPPQFAVTSSGRNILPVIMEKDNELYSFDDVAKTHETTDGIIMSWKIPEDATQAKLLIRAKNTLWLDHVFARFHGFFGARYNFFSKLQDGNPTEFHRGWMVEQSIPLVVYLEQNGQWEFFDIFELAGPLALKDDVLEINLRNFTGKSIRVKLETGFKFWEIDYVAMDFSRNLPLRITTLPILKAVDEKGNDVKQALMYDDQQYFVQNETGNAVSFSFMAPRFMGETRTLILETRGYYHILRDQRGLPNMREILSFREPGRMPLFSRELYKEMSADGNGE